MCVQKDLRVLLSKLWIREAATNTVFARSRVMNAARLQFPADSQTRCTSNPQPASTSACLKAIRPGNVWILTVYVWCIYRSLQVRTSAEAQSSVRKNRQLDFRINLTSQLQDCQFCFCCCWGVFIDGRLTFKKRIRTPIMISKVG